MVKKSKLLSKLRSGSKNIRFSEFTLLMEAFGFVFERVTGSHHIYSHPEIPQAVSVQPDANNQAKPYQIKQFLKLIEKYKLKFADESDGSAGEAAAASAEEDEE